MSVWFRLAVVVLARTEDHFTRHGIVPAVLNNNRCLFVTLSCEATVCDTRSDLHKSPTSFSAEMRREDHTSGASTRALKSEDGDSWRI